MADFVVYHSENVDGPWRPRGNDRFQFRSAKTSVLKSALGQRVWVFIGRSGGRRIRYELAGAFCPDRVARLDSGQSLISGRVSAGPADPPDVTGAPWLKALFEKNPNFSRGFAPLESEFVPHLEAAVGARLRATARSSSSGPTLSALCVYTCIAPERLEAAARRTGPSRVLTEKRTWATAKKLFDEVGKRGEEFPLIFSDARNTVDLIYWAVARSIQPRGQGTEFTFENLKPVRGHRKDELVVESTGRHLPSGYIRPYALCRTPDFLRATGDTKKPSRSTRAAPPLADADGSPSAAVVDELEALAETLVGVAERIAGHPSLGILAPRLLSLCDDLNTALGDAVPSLEGEGLGAPVGGVAPVLEEVEAAEDDEDGEAGGSDQDEDTYYEPPPIPPRSRWRRVELQRSWGEVSAKTFLLFERLGREDPDAEPDIRVWGLELFDQAQWGLVPEAYRDDASDPLHLSFPPDRFTGMPLELELHVPRVPRPGAVVSAEGDGGRHVADFVVRSVEAVDAIAVSNWERRFGWK